MKTHKKLVSILCAAALLVSALPAASAVNAEPLSKYAGKTIPVQVIEETETGLTSRVINVAIPKGTTQEEEAVLLSRAASSNGATRSVNGTNYGLSYMRYVMITRDERRIGGGTLPNDNFVSVTAVLSVSDASADNQLLLRYHRENSGVVNKWRPIYAAPGVREFVFTQAEYVMHAGDDISIYAEVPEGHGNVYLNYCSVIANGST